MSEMTSSKNVFSQLEKQNPGIASAFRTFRQREEERIVHEVKEGLLRLPPRVVYEIDEYAYHQLRMPPLFIGFILLVAGIASVAFVLGPAVAHFVVTHWQAVLLPTGGLCVGAGAVLLLSRLGSSALRNVDPPEQNTDDPLQELRALTERTATRLRAAYRLQLWAVLGVGAVFIALIAWSMVMVSQNRILYASVFGSGGVAMVILTRWNWQPFDRITEARQLADDADTLATGLRLRMKTVSEIADPADRAKAQWDAVKEYLGHS